MNISSSILSSALPALLEDVHGYSWAGIALVLCLVVYTTTRKSEYDAIPAIGGSGFFSSYQTAIRSLKNGYTVVQEGYSKHKDGIFRVPEISRWHIVVSGQKLSEELLKAPDDVLSSPEAARALFATDFTLGPSITTNPYHNGVIRGPFTRSLGELLPELVDEVTQSFEEIIPVTDDWTKVKAHETILKIVARISNRMFVGLPTCRDTEYTSLNIQFAIDVIIGARVINLFPNFLKPLAGRLFTHVPTAIKRAMKHLRPIIEQRQQKIDEHGLDYPEKPNDVLSWLMDEAEGEERTPQNLTMRILVLNFAALHTSSMTFSHALFYLASRPEYLAPLRAEVEAVIAEDGWTRAALTRMRKMDSFFKESVRLGVGALSVSRKALKPYVFSDGTQIPKGAYVSIVARANNRDDDVYPDGDTFDGFRFSKMEEEGQLTQTQLVATSTEWLLFGHGRRACPGRFFAAVEVKAMMARLILTYDIKMENEGVRPEDQWYLFMCVPNQQAGVLFRKRQT